MTTIDYEAILESEGMPAEIRSLFRGAGGCGCSFRGQRGCKCADKQQVAFFQFFDGDPKNYTDTQSVPDLETYLYWQKFQECVWDMVGLTDLQRDCLIAYSEHGNLRRACREFTITYMTARWLVKKVKGKIGHHSHLP